MKTATVTLFHLKGEPQREPMPYKECGLDDVYLTNGYTPQETPYGVGISVKHQDALHEAIGIHLASERKVLVGKEIRYLRTHMQLTQSELGKLLGYSGQQVARWEKQQSEMPGAADRLMRIVYLERAGQRRKAEVLLAKLDEMDEPTSPRLCFRSARDGWEYDMAGC